MSARLTEERVSLVGGATSIGAEKYRADPYWPLFAHEVTPQQGRAQFSQLLGQHRSSSGTSCVLTEVATPRSSGRALPPGVWLGSHSDNVHDSAISDWVAEIPARTGRGACIPRMERIRANATHLAR